MNLETTPNENALEPVWPIPAVYLLHGKGGSPNGTVKKLATVLEQHWPGLDFFRPDLPHSDPKISAEASVEYLLRMEIPRGALLLGISLGGLVAAKLQEVGREDLKVIAVSAPTWADGVVLERRAERRMSYYSSQDEVIASRIAEWPHLAAFARDYEWLTHDTDRHLRPVARFVDWYLEGTLLTRIDRANEPGNRGHCEVDELVWRLMADAHVRGAESRTSPRSGRHPRTFAKIGEAIQSGSEWESEWSAWGHEFMFTKDVRCLAEEPPIWFPPERRAMLAGASEFFAKLYDLPKPAWVDKPEYFLPEMDYYGCIISFSETEHALLMPESEEDDYRLRARTPREMLRRNVIFEARNLTVV